jgi:5-methylcytosine-specific restriction endonuclease McrA
VDKPKTVRANLIGQVFGRLTVVKFAGYYHWGNKQKHTQWYCKCSCGNPKLVGPVQGRALRRGRILGKTPSCGCARGHSKRALAGKNGFTLLWNTYLAGAKKRNLAFALSKSLFKDLTQKDCFYCGAKPSAIKTQGYSAEGRAHAAYVYNGIDRVDSKKGYYKTNVVTACRVCNRAKNSMSTAEFASWLERLFNNKAYKKVKSLARKGK